MSLKKDLLDRIQELAVELYKIQLEHKSGYELRNRIDRLSEQIKTDNARYKAEIALKEEIIQDQAKVIKELKSEKGL